MANVVGAHVRVALGGANVLVAEEFLDVANVDAVFEEVAGKAVAQAMKCGCSAESGLRGGGVHFSSARTWKDVVAWGFVLDKIAERRDERLWKQSLAVAISF